MLGKKHRPAKTIPAPSPLSINIYFKTVLISAVLLILLTTSSTSLLINKIDASDKQNRLELYPQQILQLTSFQGGLTLHGRNQITSRGLSLNHPASGLSFTALCQGKVTLTVDADFKANATHLFFTVIIDGKRQGPARYQSFEIINGQQKDRLFTLTIADNLPAGEHKIEIYRQNESGVGDIFLTELAFTGQLIIMPKQIKAEVIGDSITSGFGIYTDATKYNQNDTYYQDATNTYAFLTAQNLNLDLSVLAVSGYGLVSGWGDNHIMPKMYPFINWFKDHTDNGLYDFQEPSDFIFINLGTNDWNTKSTALNIATNSLNFYNGVINFTNLIRSYNKDSKIIWLYGMMIEKNIFENQIVKAVEDLGGENADLYVIKLPHGNSGLLGHPSLAEQKIAAEALTSQLISKFPEYFQKDNSDQSQASSIELKPATVITDEAKEDTPAPRFKFSKTLIIIIISAVLLILLVALVLIIVL